MAGMGTLIFGKTSMSSTGRATIVLEITTGLGFLNDLLSTPQS